MSIFKLLDIMLVGFLKEETYDALILIRLRKSFRRGLPDDWGSWSAHAVLTLLVGSVEPLSVLGEEVSRWTTVLALCWLVVTVALGLGGKTIVDAVKSEGYEKEKGLHKLLGKAMSCGDVEAPRTRCGDRGVRHMSPYTLAEKTVGRQAGQRASHSTVLQVCNIWQQFV